MRLLASRPRTGRTVLLAVDGRSGSGKSSFADQMARATKAPIVHLEDLYPGWDGLEAGVRILVSAVLEPLSRGLTATVPQWDWYADDWGESFELAPPPILVVEGVGAASAAVRRFANVTVWLDLDDAERRRRAMARDSATYEPHWDRWAAQEDALLTRETLPSGADLVFSTADPEATSWAT
jgi:uridine kinase